MCAHYLYWTVTKKRFTSLFFRRKHNAEIIFVLKHFTQLYLIPWYRQSCGSAFILCGSGSSCTSQCGSGSSCFCIWIQLKQICKKLPYGEISGVEKEKKRLFKRIKKHGAGPNFLNFFFVKYLPTDFYQFTCIFFGKINAAPDPGGKVNADPCRSGSTALLF